MADKATTDYRQGIADGETAAAGFADIRTHSLYAPAGSSGSYSTGWRVGMGNVRNLTVCTDRLTAGDESYRPQVEHMTARIARHARGEWSS